ncbi:abl interactor 1 isoform X2 [Ceratina calcarata]|nr:abl interactor 1 isoform X2 [Ceratina calcarata]XP_017889284.1 abl interactor 1 isoform X2 [Ceratina calcarata]XP_017889293.1 abl interactor 1 isoform X2 [Ceratina calcarata]XP_017889307.1 abl interactor 1 isoform X2 [Ceratina calcarata]
MRIPTRSAPRAPVNSTAQRNVLWSSPNDVFPSAFTQQPVQKKKPPPRPPPPKFSHSHTQKDKLRKPVRPTELLSNFFGKKRYEHSNVPQLNSQIHNGRIQPENINGSVCLIDLSPPGSPTFTTRSSSDGVSIDSFGSDGNSNPSAFTSSGNTSQTESAFEDDFDFFGMSTRRVPQNDPWQINSDPFGPIEVTNHNTVQSVNRMGDACFFAFNTNKHTNNQVLSNQAPLKTAQSMPTIIRAKPPKPPAPKILQKKIEQKINYLETDFTRSNKTVPLVKPTTLDLTNTWPDDSKNSPSPPMPTIPPPAPPPEYLTEMNNDFSAGIGQPYGIALYDFPLTQKGDLPFKEGDVIHLIRKVNDDWLEGRIGTLQGILPANFIDIKVPLPGVPDNTVTAIYPFEGETTDDLTFSEGEKITVLSRISQDWLYGECGGRKGQFPTNYVNRIPCDFTLPH